MAERIYKTWGQRFKLYENDLCEVCYLALVPNQRCSWHVHAHKVNFFFVIEGQLVVKTEWGEVLLEPYEFFTVNPGDYHEFQTHDKSAKIIEIAHVSLDPEDIHRETIGGPLNAEAKTYFKQV